MSEETKTKLKNIWLALRNRQEHPIDFDSPETAAEQAWRTIDRAANDLKTLLEEETK